jgi:hypothetical protein
MRSLIRSLVVFGLLTACRKLGENQEDVSGPEVYVLKLTEENGKACWAHCDELADRVPEELEDSVGPFCDEAATCGFAAGADAFRVVVDYGDLKFSKAPPGPTLEVSVDGAKVTPVVSSASFAEPHQHYTFRVQTPTQAGRLGLRVNGGVLTVVRPDIGACVICPVTDESGMELTPVCASSCDLTASTGQAVLQVLAPRGLTPATGTFRSTLDLVPLAETKPFTLEPLDGSLQVTGTLTIPDLASSDDIGAWLLSAVVAEGSYPTGGIPIKLTAPKPLLKGPSTCKCDGTCVVDVGAKLAFTVDVNPRVKFTSATLESEVFDGPKLAPVPGDLKNGQATLTGTAPSEPSQWVVRARVGPYASDGCTIGVAAP